MNEWLFRPQFCSGRPTWARGNQGAISLKFRSSFFTTPVKELIYLLLEALPDSEMVLRANEWNNDEGYLRILPISNLGKFPPDYLIPVVVGEYLPLGILGRAVRAVTTAVGGCAAMLAITTAG